jgi:predicted glycosyltransferase
MKILIDIGHPANFLLVKNLVKVGIRNKHSFCITIREKDVTKNLLDLEGIKYVSLGKPRIGLISKFVGLIYFSYKLYKISRDFKPDIYISHSSIYCSMVSLITKVNHISFHANDSIAAWHNLLLRLGTKVFITPSCIKTSYGSKQIKYNGNHELAYLHPSIYLPDYKIVKNYGFINKKYVLFRFVSWNAIDDFRIKGLTDTEKIELVEIVKSKFDIIISSEQKLPQSLMKYKIDIPYNKFQDFIASSAIVIGESGSVASEAAVLGVPSIYYSRKKISFIEELQEYGLCLVPKSFQELKDIIIRLINDEDIGILFQKQRDKYINNVINVPKLFNWFVFNYPESYSNIKKNKGSFIIENFIR